MIVSDTTTATLAPEERAEGTSSPAWRPPRKTPLAQCLIVVTAVAAITAILAAWRLPPFQGTIETTDNAFVRGRTTVIASQVSGYVVEVSVRDYASVRAGQVLARIDDRIYRARVEQARANVDAQLAALANSEQARASRMANLEGQVAALGNARAQLLRAKADSARTNTLVGEGWAPIRDRDQMLAGLAQAEAQVHQAEASGEIARQDIRTVDVGRNGLEAQVEASRAQLRLAEIDLENTVIRAPEPGQIGEVGVRLGEYVTNGTQFLSLVPSDRWVIANYKEAQIAHMAPGQSASFTVDALDGALLTGRIETLSPAAGSEFSVLKPDNATGNFVKVPQRISVRIVIDPDQLFGEKLRPGMSVEARVDTRDGGR